MWVRAVAVAVAVLGWAATAQAGQYTEVWNPPEATHPPRHAKKHAVVAAKAPTAKVGQSRKGKVPKLASKKAAHVHVAAKTSTGGKRMAAAKVAGKPARGHVKMAQAQTRSKSTVHGKTVTQAKVAHPKAGKMAAVKPAMTQPSVAQPAPAMASATPKPSANTPDLPPILH